MPKKASIHIMHTSHLDLFWMGSQETCLEWGSRIIRDAAHFAKADKGFYFMIETVRFLEYLLERYPEEYPLFRELFETGQLEVTADYVDRLENSHDGECLVRNVQYGKKLLRELMGLSSQVCFHPDLPGSAEQTPQVLKKIGVDYYLGARGFAYGGRFYWKGLDQSRIIHYNFPCHYSYYSVEDGVLDRLDEVKKAISSGDSVAICMSGGDLGPADSFFKRLEDGGGVRVALREHMRELTEKYPEIDFRMDNIVRTLDGMDLSGLEEREGENPSRWGHHASALHVELMMKDKLLAAALTDAEKLHAISGLLGGAVAIGFPCHPLAHKGTSGGKRKYIELDRAPTGATGWLEEAWRYLLITQDHNYGGVDGAQTQFDRFRYKEAGLEIANGVCRAALDNIAARVPSGGLGLLVFNTLNWRRDGCVSFTDDRLGPNERYLAEDDAGNRAPVVRRGDEYSFMAKCVPSVGYKRFSLKKDSGIWPGCEMWENDDGVLLQNPYLSIWIDRATGAVHRITNRATGKNLVSGAEFGTINAYQDDSVSVDDSVVDKPLLDESRKHVTRLSILRSDPLGSTVRVTTEILNCKTCVDISLAPDGREAVMDVTLYWIGIPHKQIKLNLDLTGKSGLYYGVPYGAQVKGNPLEGGVVFKKDEINGELYRRYREVEKWFALQDDGGGVLVSSNHSAYEFLDDGIRVLLMRCVPNCGDTGVMFHNTGVHSYRFALTPYEGSWGDGVWRAGWEPAQPMRTATLDENAPEAPLEPERSFLDTGGQGILTVFKETNGGYELRLFDTSGEGGRVALKDTLGLSAPVVTDLELKPSKDSPDLLAPYEIKTYFCAREG